MKRSLSASDLIAEGKRLSKPSLLLSDKPNGGAVVGYWRGHREGFEWRPGFEHRITVDCQWLASQGIRVRGSLAIYDVDGYGWSVPVFTEWLPEAPLSALDMRGGTPLYATESFSFPPIEALCLYGGAVVDAWLETLGLERTDYHSARIAHNELGEAYQRIYRQHSPLHSKSHWAVLGGWHAIWPDDDFYIPREMRLAIWTLKEPEPWIEVFERAPNFMVRARFT